MNLYLALSQDYFNFPNPVPKNGGVINCLKGAVKYILSFTQIPYGVLLGGVRKKEDRYYYLITMEKLKRIKWSINEQLKNDFLNNVKNDIEPNNFNNFKSTLSNKFFMNPIKSRRIPTTFYGSPDNLFKEEFCQLLFIDKKLHFIGVQHGGQSSELKQDRFGEFECSISDEYYCWGLGKKNIKQNRFNNSVRSFDEIKKIFLVEVLDTNVLLNNLFSGFQEMHEHFNHHNNNFQYSKLLTGLLSHPRSLNNGYQSFSERKLFNDLKENEIHSILYIINFPTQTFMYKAIYENLPFLMFINREWHKWFTPNYSKFLEFMNSRNVLFYWDQESEFISCLEMIIETGEYGRMNNKEIMNYLER